MGIGSTQRALRTALLALLISGVFALDLIVPRGVAGGVPYVVPVLLALSYREPRAPLVVAAVCSGLTLLGFFLSPHGSDLWVVASNRGLALFAIWVTAILGRAGGRTRRALEAERERAAITLEAIGDAVISTDTGGIVQYVNPTAEELTGWTRDEAEGQPLDRIFHVVDERTLEPMPDPVSRCLTEKRTVGPGEQTRLTTRSGEGLSIQDTASPILGPSGECVGSVLVFSDVTDARRRFRRVAHQATHDGLTGLVNRAEFERRLQRLLESAHAGHGEHALCYLDLDRFKQVNDACGHLAGDELLRRVARLARARVRERDTVARLGGDEFALLLEHCSYEQAARVADNLRREVRGLRFRWDEHRFEISVSIGLVPITAASRDIQAVLRAADEACYAAKHAGRDRLQADLDEDPNARGPNPSLR